MPLAGSNSFPKTLIPDQVPPAGDSPESETRPELSQTAENALKVTVGATFTVRVLVSDAEHPFPSV